MTQSAAATQGILLLSSGSKVAIARIAREATRKRGLTLHGSDRSSSVPTRRFVDTFVVFKNANTEAWIEEILGYCKTHRIGLVIPTRHQELATLAKARERFTENGIALSISSSETIERCNQKLETFRFLRENGIPTPESVLRSQLADSPLQGIFPLFAKPASGAASAGATLVNTPEQLERIPADWLIQEVAGGHEYTLYLYLDREGKVLCCIPHRRIATEAGEVVQARTERIPKLIDLATAVASKLPGAQGIINLQAFYDPETQRAQIIEINPRIGGGYPLIDQAKGHYIDWLCQEWLDGAPPRPFDRWTENLLMMRYREAVFEIQ